MLIGRLDEPFHDREGLLEFLDELLMFLVAPSLSQADELTVDRGHLVEHFGVELFEADGKPPEIFRVDDRLSHEYALSSRDFGLGRTPRVIPERA